MLPGGRDCDTQVQGRHLPRSIASGPLGRGLGCGAGYWSLGRALDSESETSTWILGVAPLLWSFRQLVGQGSVSTSLTRRFSARLVILKPVLK